MGALMACTDGCHCGRSTRQSRSTVAIGTGFASDPARQRFRREYLERERFSAQQWSVWQNEAVREVLRSAALHVPYYSKTWNDSQKAAGVPPWAGHRARRRSLDPRGRGRDGPERSRLETAARELQLSSEEVSFIGERDDVPALLRQADAFVLCSKDEGTPNALLEAMALGLPVIATPVGDVGALIVDGQTGFLVPVGEGEVLADRLRRLASSVELRERLGCEARRLVAVRHGRDRLPGRLLELYRSLGDVVTGSRLRRALRWNLGGPRSDEDASAAPRLPLPCGCLHK